MDPAPSRAAYAQLLFGVFCCSTSVLFIKLSASDPVYLAAWRQLAAALLLLPWFLAARRGHPGVAVPWGRVILPGCLLGIHFVSWIAGARLTPAANSSLIVNLVPVALPFLLAVLARERVTAREAAGSAVAMTGVVLLAAGDFDADPTYLLGDIVCFGSMLLYAGYLAGGRAAKDVPHLLLYLVPVYAIGGLCCLACGALLALAAPFGVAIPGLEGPLLAPGWREWVAVGGLTLVPTILGHTLINRALRTVRGQVVGVCNLAQFLFAGIMAWWFLGEQPGPAFAVAGVLVVAGALVVLTGKPSGAAR